MKQHNQYNPPIVFHPGELLAEKLDELGMGPKEFAVRSAKPEKTVTAILKGQSSITPDMAVRFESVTKIPAMFWLRHQQSYYEYGARKKRLIVLRESRAWAKRFPLSEMMKLKWIEKTNDPLEQTAQLLSFFGVSGADAWEDYYLKQKLKVAFGITLKHHHHPHSLSAWLRKGELQATHMEAPEYSATKFKKTLLELKSLMNTESRDWMHRLQKLCLSAGLKLVFTPSLSQLRVNGATRWINSTPLIQMSDKYKGVDVFWHNFFHQAGHVVLHGKKEVFLESENVNGSDAIKDSQARAFAMKLTLSEAEELQVREANTMGPVTIRRFAKQFNTHPAIIAARLHEKKLISSALTRQFVKPIVLV